MHKLNNGKTSQICIQMLIYHLKSAVRGAKEASELFENWRTNVEKGSSQ